MSSTAIVDAIVEVLSEDKDKEWSQEALAAHVLATKQTGVKAPFHIETAIRTLVAAGRLHGIVKGGSARDVKYRPDKDEAALAALKKLSDVNASLRQQLEASQGSDVTALLDKVTAMTEKIKVTMSEKDSLAQRVDELHAKCEQLKDQVLVVRTTNAQGETRETKGVFHKAFKRILKLASARKNTFIYGPTGCGKTHICEQVADALGLRFKFVSCTAGMSEGQLSGRLLPIGENGKFEFIMAEFLDAFENGGLFLADEFDAADANVTLVLNSALANRKMSVPNRPDKPYAVQHPDFIFIAAANTVGTGASRTYSGRNKLDMATLDRFNIGKVYMDYDPAVEAAQCPDEALRARLLKYRKAINEHGLERAMSTRFMKDAYEMMHMPEDPDMRFTDEEIDEAFFQGWREDEINKIKSFRG